MTPTEQEHCARHELGALTRDHPLGYEPVIEWRNLRVTAGLADFKHRKIILSRLLLNNKERLESTLKHEYAHLLAFARHGRKGAGHGAAWKRAMADLGLDARVHHTYEVSRNQARQEIGYRCAACGFTFLRRRHLPKRGRYLHAGCGGTIVHEYTKRITPESGKA